MDPQQAAAIKQCLSKEGFVCFMDIDTIPGSEEWVRAIAQAIRECHVCVTVVSRYSIESEHVVLELTFVRKRKKPFVPLLLSRDLRLPNEVDFLPGNRQTFTRVTQVLMVCDAPGIAPRPFCLNLASTQLAGRRIPEALPSAKPALVIGERTWMADVSRAARHICRRGEAE